MPRAPLTELRLEPVRYGSAEVQALTGQVQDYYRRLYGGTDDSPLDEADVTPPEGDFLLGRLDGVAVAMGGWRRVAEVTALGGGQVGELRRMFVVPSARRRRVARTLLGGLEQRAAAAGIDVMILSTGAPQHDALAFYRSCGYADVPAFGYYAGSSQVRCLGRRIAGSGKI